MHTEETSGKGRWIGRLLVLALLLVAFAALLWFLGRPVEPKWIEVDVTDTIAAGAPQ